MSQDSPTCCGRGSSRPVAAVRERVIGRHMASGEPLSSAECLRNMTVVRFELRLACSVALGLALVAGCSSAAPRPASSPRSASAGTVVREASLPSFLTQCSRHGLQIRPLPTGTGIRLRRSRAVRVIRGHHVTGLRWVGAALVRDPVAPKLAIGSRSGWRVMWVGYSLTITPRYQHFPSGAIVPVQPQPGTRSTSAALVDDKTGRYGGAIGCRVVTPPRRGGESA